MEGLVDDKAQDPAKWSSGEVPEGFPVVKGGRVIGPEVGRSPNEPGPKVDWDVGIDREVAEPEDAQADEGYRPGDEEEQGGADSPRVFETVPGTTPSTPASAQEGANSGGGGSANRQR